MSKTERKTILAAKKFFKFMYAAIFVLSAALTTLIFTTCNTPFGMGDAIDFEPPVLTMVPVPPNPMYVRNGAVLSGTVVDNIGVDRVILREASSGQQLFQASLKGDNWEIVMSFDENQANEKLSVELVAYDKAGNSGEQSIIALTIIVDIRPPVIEDMWIQRTELKTADLEPYDSLKALETLDPRGERSGNSNRYQNGFFTLMGKVAENETRIDIVSLNIYDEREPNEPLLELSPNHVAYAAGDNRASGSSNFSPRWLVSEETILDAGEALWPGYKNDYYSNDKRYYYRVVIIASDKSENPSEYHENFYLEGIRVEEQGFFCMWRDADRPKGIVDPLVAGTSRNIVVTKGATLPVEFFDDDQLLWAFTGLLTEDQWFGKKGINANDSIPGGETGDPDAKLVWLRNKLLGMNGVTKGDVYNWRYDRYTNDISGKIIDLAAGKSISDVTNIVQTGNTENDNGQYILFSLVADRKLPPHPDPAVNTPDTYKTRERLVYWTVDVIDENEPLIVFDTVNTTLSTYEESKHPGFDTIGGAKTGNSPEENTFPRLTGGSTFEINGYTLRANKKGTIQNTVLNFRMAWIPAGRGDDYIPQVQRALQDGSYPDSMSSLETLGIQHWNFTPDSTSPNTYPIGRLVKGTDQQLDTTNTDDIFTKQVFRKKFSVLPNQTDDMKTAYKNFTYTNNGVETHENDIKLFVFYAEDNMGHVVFRQVRLLGNKSPPEMTIYDLTVEPVVFAEGPQPGGAAGLPDLNNSDSSVPAYYFFNSNGIIDSDSRAKYETVRKAFQPTGYNRLDSIVKTPAHIAAANAAYPRNTIVKYWVTAKSNGDLAVRDISIRDITFSSNVTNIGEYNNVATALSYVEKLSEVTQRVFLFTATDSLGNPATVQRTVAVTNAAVLNSITSQQLTGSYGIGKTIELRANFSNLVRWEGTNPPLLNLRFKKGVTNTSTGGDTYVVQVPTKTPGNAESLFLEFDYVVREGDGGVLESMYFHSNDYQMIDANGNTVKGTEGLTTVWTPAGAIQQGRDTDRPITLPSGTSIKDASRGDDAFTPRNSPSYNWTAQNGDRNSVQGGNKKITLEGLRPRLTAFELETDKTVSTDGYFFRADETITFKISSGVALFSATGTAPTIGFQVGDNTSWRNASYAPRAGAATDMYFSVIVNSTNTPQDGQIMAIRLNDLNNIVDGNGNKITAGTVGTISGDTIILRTEQDGVVNNNIRIDKTAPTAPRIELENAAGNYDDDNSQAPVEVGQTPAASERVIYYRESPRFVVSGNGGETFSTTTQYSIDGGVSWTAYTAALNLSNGQYTVMARLTDRAGNIGAVRSQKISVNVAFPSLLAVTTDNVNAYYRAGSNITVTLHFSEPVWTSNRASIYLTLRNRNPSTSGGIYEQILTGTQVEDITNRTAAKTSVTFTWSNISGKEMQDGLYVSAVNFAGLSDRFGNTGGSATATISGTAPNALIGGLQPGAQSSTAENLNGAGVKVDCIAPTVSARTPSNAADAPTTGSRTAYVSSDNTTITLNFSEPVQKGNGTITIRPHGNYAIPPVLENDGYYLTVAYSGTSQTETRSSSASANSTYVYGMNDIYNNMTTAQRNTLITGGTLSAPTLSDQTGLSVGPYKKTTQGLKTGAGYTGNYSNISPTAPAAPGAAGTFMIPDTATKWVLDYQYTIHADSGVVNDIRSALTNMGFRRQDIAVTLSNVVITDNIVKITLSEPLLPGLQWGLFYPAGTFTDLAGNPAVAESYTNGAMNANSAYWFWSRGVQRPVVRVDRKSYDGRQTVPAIGNSNTAVAQTYNNANAYSGTIASFNSVAYRIETETLDARIYYGTLLGTSYTSGGAGSITGAWTGRATLTTGTNFNTADTLHWDGSSGTTTMANKKTNANQTIGEWVRPNLIFRNYNGSAVNNPQTGTYTVTENGISVTQVVAGPRNVDANTGAITTPNTGNYGNNYYGFRSFNRDATSTELDVALTSFSNESSVYSSTFTYDNLQASKNYVMAEARIDHLRGGTFVSTHTSQKGFEGVFRTVVALNQAAAPGYSATNNTRYVLLCGTNVKSGIPTVAGFPVKDGVANTDTRYLKVFYINGTNQYYWVSTEMVTSWYMQSYKRGEDGGSYLRVGDATDWMTAGYGDLSYAYNVYSW